MYRFAGSLAIRNVTLQPCEDATSVDIKIVQPIPNLHANVDVAAEVQEPGKCVRHHQEVGRGI